MLRAVEVQNLAVVADQKQAIENAEVESDHCEEIHSGDNVLMVLQESPPALTAVNVAA